MTSPEDAQQRVDSHLLQTLKTLRSGNDTEVALAAAKREQELVRMFAPPLATPRRRHARKSSSVA